MRRVLRNKYYVNGRNNASKSIVIWELSSAHFYRKVISEITWILGNVTRIPRHELPQTLDFSDFLPLFT